MQEIMTFLTKPIEANMRTLLKKEDKYKITLIVIVFALFPLFNSIFDGVNSGFFSFIFGVLGDLIAEAFFILVILLIGKLFSGKAKFIDIFFSVALAGIIMLVTSLITNLLAFLGTENFLVGLISGIVGIVGFIWYLYVWVKGLAYVEKFPIVKSIFTALLSILALGFFYSIVVIGLVGFLIALPL